MKLNRDLTSAKLIYLKATLFLVIGLLSVSALLLDNFSLRTAFLLLLTIWSFCRLYYFFFYVIEKYVDPTYKFAGLHSFVIYAWQQRRKHPRPPQ